MTVIKNEEKKNTTQNEKRRYHSTPYNNSLKIKNLFNLPETQIYVNNMYLACEDYCSKHSTAQNNGYKRVLGQYILSLPVDFDVKNLDGKYFSDFYNETPGPKQYKSPFTKDLIRTYLNLNQTYKWNEDLLHVANIIAPFWDDIQNIHRSVIPLLDGTLDPYKCKLFKTNSVNNGKPNITLLKFDTDDLFIQDLLLEYQQTQYDVQPRVYHVEFFHRFAESLDYELPSDIYGFNANTLLKQDVFFKSIRREPEQETRQFYRFILEKQGDHKTITIQDGISIPYLMSENFGVRYADGYRFIPINPNDPIPKIDKWAISPNGLESSVSTDKPEDILYIDFTRFSNEKIRECAKSWFWHESKAGLTNRYRNITYIAEFFEYRDELRSMYFDKFVQARSGTDLDLQNTILSEEVISYVNKWNESLSSESYRKRIVPLKLFLQYMNENNKYKTEIAAFEYLQTGTRGNKSKQEILPIPKEDFSKLVTAMEEKAKNNNLHMLYYIVFCLNTLTPLRISSILDLKDDCLVEKSRGIYALKAKVKSSNGEEKDIQISKEVKRLVEVALSSTAQNRKKAPTQQKNYLFLVNNQKNIYRSIPQASYNNHLHNCCNEAGIPRYSAQNLRKTYYTNLIENAIKKNVSLMNLKELTDHSSIDTTENYYVKENIRNYLEITYGVEIGNIPIAGSVVAEYPEAQHEDIVNDGCGYCRNPECNILGTANCLMCKGFITTPSHIPQFEESINTLSQQILNNQNSHDKEHLYAVKRLYAAYLEQLFMRKRESENATATG